MQYFQDRFIRREINNLEVICPFSETGCHWEGKFQEYQQNHIKHCNFHPTPMEKSYLHHFSCTVSPEHSLSGISTHMLCDVCHELVPLCEVEVHRENCMLLQQGKQCPLKALGCTNERYMHQSEMNEHFQESEYNHLSMLANCIQLLSRDIENNSAIQRQQSSLLMNEDTQQHLLRVEVNEIRRVQNSLVAPLQTVITSLQDRVIRLEEQIHSMNTVIEDCNFRLSLIENSNHDGSMIWKIPQFSQRRADAQNGKYMSQYSTPFFSGRYGYKMCLRLYIMGDGIGKGTHLSLFFVVMRGEFDNILQWPFTHKVTFKLINQAGGRDIVDTFQPDPMSSSFRKPKSDMNIASGCPRFVSHTELERGGFIVDDTVFIKCAIDTSTIRHP